MMAVAVLVICVTPAAFALPGLQALYLLPIAVAVYVARVRTTASPAGIEIRALFGRRELPWSSLKGLALTRRGNVRAVTTSDERIALPSVRTRHLPVLALVSNGRLPDPTGLTDDLVTPAGTTSGDTAPQGAAPADTAPKETGPRETGTAHAASGTPDEGTEEPAAEPAAKPANPTD